MEVAATAAGTCSPRSPVSPRTPLFNLARWGVATPSPREGAARVVDQAPDEAATSATPPLCPPAPLPPPPPQAPATTTAAPPRGRGRCSPQPKPSGLPPKAEGDSVGRHLYGRCPVTAATTAAGVAAVATGVAAAATGVVAAATGAAVASAGIAAAATGVAAAATAAFTHASSSAATRIAATASIERKWPSAQQGPHRCCNGH